MYFCVNEFAVGVNDSIFSANEQQKCNINRELVTMLSATASVAVLAQRSSRFMVRIRVRIRARTS